MRSTVTRVLATTVIQSEISMALPIPAAASAAPLLHPAKPPSFLLCSAGTITDWYSKRGPIAGFAS